MDVAADWFVRAGGRAGTEGGDEDDEGVTVEVVEGARG